MKKFIVLLSLLLLPVVAFGQGTQISRSQLKDGIINDIKVDPNAAISHTKINFTGISPTIVNAENPLTFNTPLSRTGNVISLTVVPVTLGGTGLTTVAAGRIPFGNSSTQLNTASGFTFLSSILTTPGLTISGTTVTINGKAYIWPSAYGAAGSKLVDAAGDGILSWGAGGGGVTLQTTPGTPDTGGFNVSTDGYVGRKLFVGDGTQLPTGVTSGTNAYIEVGNETGTASTEHYYIRANTADSSILAGSDSFWGIHLLFRNNNPATAMGTSMGAYFETSTQGSVTTQIGVSGVVALDGPTDPQSATSVYGGFFRPVTELASVKTIGDIVGSVNQIDLISGTNNISNSVGSDVIHGYIGATTNTISSVFGFRVRNVIDAATTASNWYGYYYSHPGAGAITNEYGVYLEDVGSDANAYAYYSEGGKTRFAGDHEQKGAITVTALSTPGAPTITPQGTGGAITWTYKIVAVLADGEHTAASAGGSTAVGNGTLDGTNFNRITWSAVQGATSYNIYRTAVGTTPATTGLIGNTTVLVLDDTALAGDTSSEPTQNSTGVAKAKWFATTVGTPIADAATIAPDGSIVHVTGTGTPITTITPPYDNFIGQITIIADDAGGTATSTGGNIALGSTVAQNKALILVYDGSNWYPIY